MRFLYGLVAMFWLLFGWVCVQSMQWKPAYPTPPHVRFELRQTAPQEIDQRIEAVKTSITESHYSDSDQSEMHHQLGRLYWLKAFLQDSRGPQDIYLQFAMEEYEKAQLLNPDDVMLHVRIADIYSVFGELEQAEKLYLETLEKAKENRARDAENTIQRRLRYYMNYDSEDRRDFSPRERSWGAG